MYSDWDLIVKASSLRIDVCLETRSILATLSWQSLWDIKVQLGNKWLKIQSWSSKEECGQDVVLFTSPTDHQ